MAYYNVCPNCGGNLDPGEKCDCKNEKQEDNRNEAGRKGGEIYGGYFAAAGRALSRSGNRAVRMG